MKFQFYGAAQSVTGSMHLLETAGFRLLLDCGLFQGRRDDAEKINRKLPFPGSSIHAVILSHAHIDHAGNLPNLVRSGFRGKIFMTPASADLCAVMLRDSGRIQESDAAYMNKKWPHKKPVVPLYSLKDVEETIRQFEPIPYHQWFELNPLNKARFLDAGHILGSGIVEVETKEGDQILRTVFTGDLGRRGLPILQDPEPLPECNFVISESTYGNRVHPQAEDLEKELAESVQECVQRAGRVIIPAFSLGRTQSLIYSFARLMRSGRLPHIPIFVDSPLSTEVTKVLARHPEVYDEQMRQTIADQGSPLFFKGIHYVESVEESKKLNNTPNPIIIISASGMCESGRVLHHLKNAIEDSRNMILLVGYQAVNTLGRRLKDGEAKVRILGEEFYVRARVKSFDGFSAHADQNELVAALEPLTKKAQAVFLVHGEDDAAASLAAALKEKGFRRVEIPQRGSTYSF